MSEPTSQPQPPSMPRPASSARLQRRLSAASLHRKAAAKAAREEDQQRREETLAVARRVPMDMLAKDWLDAQQATLKTRCYFVEKVLPTLVPALEKLLRDAERRGVIATTAPGAADGGDDKPAAAAGFNPVNHLAQVLMRTNPKWSNLGGDTSPYVQSLKVVEEELKLHMYSIEGNRSARIAADVEKRRKQVEEEEAAKVRKEEQRLDPLLSHFAAWSTGDEPASDTGGGGDDDGASTAPTTTAPTTHVDHAELVAGIQGFYKVFGPTATRQPRAVLQAAKFPGLPPPQAGKRVTPADFVKLLGPLTTDLPEPVLAQLAAHLDTVFAAQVQRSQFNARQQKLRALFDDCDHAKTGRIQRSRLEAALQDFYKLHNTVLRRPSSLNMLPASASMTGDDAAAGGGVSPSRSADDCNLLEAMRSFTQLQDPQRMSPDYVNRAEFDELIEDVLGEDPEPSLLDKTCSHVRGAFVESEEERIARLQAEEKQKKTTERSLKIRAIFEKWDNDCSGFLEIDELGPVLARWRQVDAKAAEEIAEKMLATSASMQDKEADEPCLSCREFASYVEQHWLKECGSEDDEAKLLRSLMGSINLNFEEERRGSTRKQWLKELAAMAHSVHCDPAPVYVKVFEIVREDWRQFGAVEDGDAPSVHITEAITSGSEVLALQFVAATPADEDSVVGQRLRPADGVGVSFVAARRGKPVHVSSIAKHGHIKLFKSRKLSQETDGSFLVLPLRDPNNKRITHGVFGTLGIDTLSRADATAFEKHQLAFYQGLSHALPVTLLSIKRKAALRAASRDAFSWLQASSRSILSTAYLSVAQAANATSGTATVRRYTSAADRTGTPISKDQQHVAQCAEDMEVTIASQSQCWSTAVPVLDASRDLPVGVIDISSKNKLLPEVEHDARQVSRLMTTLLELLGEGDVAPAGVQPAPFEWHFSSLYSDGFEDPASRQDILWWRCMFLDARRAIAKLNAPTLSELSGQLDMPPAAHQTVAAILLLLTGGDDDGTHNSDTHNSDTGGEAPPSIDDWHHCRAQLTTELAARLLVFDPSDPKHRPALDAALQRLHGITRSGVRRIGIPVLGTLYHWLTVAIELANRAATCAKRRPRTAASARHQQQQQGQAHVQAQRELADKTREEGKQELPGSSGDEDTGGKQKVEKHDDGKEAAGEVDGRSGGQDEQPDPPQDQDQDAGKGEAIPQREVGAEVMKPATGRGKACRRKPSPRRRNPLARGSE
eukprot:m.141809 g.141809  ORF g.141809 m.141809 type:complete len:1231 (-) comp17126_c0_seq4:372-4064(-)